MVSTKLDELTFDQFVESFVAGLVSRGIVKFSPNAADTNIALFRLASILREESEKTKGTPEGVWIRRLRNQITPSNLGTFDSFFSALRAKQLGYVASPNPSYNDINFKISPAFAQSVIAALGPIGRSLVDKVITNFLDEPVST